MRTITFICLWLYAISLPAQYASCVEAVENKTCGISFFMADLTVSFSEANYFAFDATEEFLEVFWLWECDPDGEDGIAEFLDVFVILYSECGGAPINTPSGCNSGPSGENAYSFDNLVIGCLLYTSPSPRDATLSRMPSSA